MLIALLTAAALSAASGPPVMRVEGVPLTFARPGDVEVFVDRVAAESRAFCAVHHARVTPEQAGDSRPCARVMGDRAARALSPDARARFIQAGGVRALHRRLR